MLLTARGRRRSCVALALIMAATSLVFGGTEAKSTSRSIFAYRGLGSWVDIYDTYEWDHPRLTVREMAQRGVRTLYLETGNYRIDERIFRPDMVERFIHQAHAHDMRVVAWYLPGFRHLREDKRRVMAAIDFRTRRGQRFDSFALDIEADIVHPISLRKERMLRLSRWIRRDAGRSYPLGAIVLSPYGLKRVPDYWGPVWKFPFAELERIYDVFLPMSYFTWRVEKPGDVFDYNSFNVRYIRRRSGNNEVPIHPIGGISDEATGAQTRAYVDAVRYFGLIGGSYYAFDGTRREHWRELRRIPVNPRQSPALPLRLAPDYGPAIGNVPKADRSHPKEVFFRSGGRSEAQELRFRVFDAGRREIRLWVNGRAAATVPRGPANAWSEVVEIRIPRWRLHAGRRNVLAFVARGDFPDWSTWGVKRVSLRAAG